MTRTWIAAMVVLAVGLLPNSSGAQGGRRAVTGGLVPFVPSQLVQLATPPVNDPPGCGGAIAYPVNQRVNPDGSREAFAVPTGQVFVLTSASWAMDGVGDSTLTVVLFLVSGDGPRRNFLFDTSQPAFGNKVAGHALLGDVLMRSGDTLCIMTTEPTGAGGSAVVHGFLTADE